MDLRNDRMNHKDTLGKMILVREDSTKYQVGIKTSLECLRKNLEARVTGREG